MSAAALQEIQSAPLALIGSARAGRSTLLDMLLSARGYEIAIREDGPSVLEFLKEHQPAIAIFDHDLPGMDGREICSRMRFISRLAATPVAIVTSTVEDMGGIAEFENFTDTTTADIVEAEPLGKKKLIERLENVSRDQKEMANSGKVTIAIPTMVPPIPAAEPPQKAKQEIDVFLDDDVDIEVDVARAIYSADGSHERVMSEESEPIGEEDEASDPEVVFAEPQDVAPALYEEAADQVVHEVAAEVALEAGDEVEPSDGDDEWFAFDHDMFLNEGEAEAAEPTAVGEDVDLFSHDATGMSTRADEGAAWPNADSLNGEQNPSESESDFIAAPEAETSEAVAGSPATGAEAKATAEADLAPTYAAHPIQAIEPAEAGADAIAAPETEDDELADEELTATIERAIEAVNRASMEETEYLNLHMSRTVADHDEEPEARVADDQITDSRPEVETRAQTTDDVDVKSTVEMVVESAYAQASHEDHEDDSSDEAVSGEAEVSEMENSVNPLEAAEEEAVSEAGEVEFDDREVFTDANNYADDDNRSRLQSLSATVDGQEEREPAVLNEERNNMQALIAEQAERIDALQQRNVLLRQELEQRKADEGMRGEERSKLQALIKEQTEAITNLQQRNVQLRQEIEQTKLALEQFKAEQTKRESEFAFLQSHTSEQAETIAKLQQLNTLLRQELEQRKADEAPLRDFLQRLLDRDEKSSAYQEALRNDIISLGRDNS